MRRTIGPHQKLPKIPHDIRRPILERQLFFQVTKHRPSVFTVHIRLFEKRELVSRIELLDEFENLLRRSRFLSSELVARKREDFKAAASVLVRQTDELGVISLGEGSFRRHIDHAQNMTLVFVHGHLRAVNESILQPEEGARCGDGRLLAVHGSCDEGLCPRGEGWSSHNCTCRSCNHDGNDNDGNEIRQGPRSRREKW